MRQFDLRKKKKKKIEEKKTVFLSFSIGGQSEEHRLSTSFTHAINKFWSNYKQGREANNT